MSSQLAALLGEICDEQLPSLGYTIDDLLRKIRVRRAQGDFLMVLGDPTRHYVTISLLKRAAAGIDFVIGQRGVGLEETSESNPGQGRAEVIVCLRRILNILDGRPQAGDLLYDPHASTSIPWDDIDSIGGMTQHLRTRLGPAIASRP